MTACEYCGLQGELGEALEVRHDRIACRDTGACDDREARTYSAYLADLRRRQRDGDELTEAEQMDLAAAR